MGYLLKGIHLRNNPVFFDLPIRIRKSVHLVIEYKKIEDVV
jgi:hypothetical protein